MDRDQFFAPLRIGAAAVGGLCLLEAGLLAAAGEQPSLPDFVLSLGLGFAGATAWWAGITTFKKYSGHPGDVSRVTSLAVALALLYLVLADWFIGSAFADSRRLIVGPALAVLAGLIIALGRMLYIFFSVRGPDLAKARFQALAPVAVLAAGLWSAAGALLTGSRLAVATLAIAVFIIAGQYFAIRMIWGGRRDRWRRAGLRIQYLLLIAAPVALAILFGRGIVSRSADTDAPPIILITVDALRADFVHAINPKAAPTPAMDRLAADGIVFEHAMASSSWTNPGLGSIMTGLFAERTGAGRASRGIHLGPDASLPLLAETLRAAGYATAARVDNPWLQGRGFDRGFDDYHEGHAPRRPGFLVARAALGITGRLSRPLGLNAEGITGQAISWLDRRPSRPFFLWLHYLDPHVPYVGHRAFPVAGATDTAVWLSRNVLAWHLYGWNMKLGPADYDFITGRYRGEVLFTDHHLGRLLDHLRRDDLYDRSVIVLTADHGEELFDHGGFEHGHSFYHEVLNVPLIVKLPRNRHAGARVTEWIGMDRLAGTLAGAAGAGPAHGTLLSCLEPAGCPADGPAAWRAGVPMYAGHRDARGTRDGIKIITRTDGQKICFDLNFDPDELIPLPLSACPSSALVAVEDTPGTTPLSSPDSPAVSEESRRRLRALGYMQ